MTEKLFVTGVVIPNGVADTDGDILDKTDIKKIFTKYTNRDTDVMHTRIRNEGVNVLANWITEADVEIAGKTAPAGSWLATFEITNEEIIKSLKSSQLTGLSLGSVSDFALTQKYWFINKSINYKDLNDAEEVIPLFISFVDKPANQYGLEIMDYEVYINKRAKNVDGEKMTENIEEPIAEEKISVTAFERLMDKFFDKFSINKAETEEKPEEVEEEKPAEETTGDITNAELLEELKTIIPQAMKDAFMELAEMDKAETEEEKPEEEKKEEESEEIEKSEEETSEEEEEEKEEVEIDKRQTVKTENIVEEKTSNFYTKTGRDGFGRKLRK